VTLLAPLKHITTLRFPKKLSIFVRATDPQEQTRSTPLAIEPAQPVEPVRTIELAPLPPTASEILEQIGSKLRQLREERQLSIEDMSALTQIQPRSIQAIETGHIEILPEPVYVKGMVKRYGDSLGLDGMAISGQVPTWEPAAAMFDAVTKLQTTGFGSQTTGFGTQTTGFGSQTTGFGAQTTGFGSQTTGFTRQVTGFSSHTTSSDSRTSGFSRPFKVNPRSVYLGYLLAILAIGAATSHFLNNAIQPPSAPLSEAVRVDRAAGIASNPSAIATQTVPTPGVRVGIAIKARLWAQIGVDGTTKFTGNLQPGMQLSWIATKQVTIGTNNAGGLLLARDAQPLQPLGKIGQKQHVTIKVGK
jgi:cytoskeleton protein RodZ